MTEQRRAGAPLVVLALGLALLAALLLVVPGSSPAPSKISYMGSGSTTVSVVGPVTGPNAVTDRPAGAGPEQSSVGTKPVADGPGNGSTATATEPPDSDGDSSHRPTDPDGQRHFYISVGSVSGLYPGKQIRLPIVFHNPLPTDISVRSATTRATGPRGCDVSTSLLLRTRYFIHRVIVPAHGSKAKSLRFGMLKTATDACQGAVFTVYVSAFGIPA